MHRLQHGGSHVEMRRCFTPSQRQFGQLFQPLDRIAIAAPRVSRNRVQEFMSRPFIGLSHLAIQRVDRHTAIRRQCPDQAGISALAVATRNTGQGNHQAALQRAFWGLAEDVQPVANLRFFQFTQIGVQLGQITVLVRAGHAHVGVQAGGRCQRQDFPAQMINAARIYACRLEILIHQRLKITQRAIGFGARQRWRQMINDHRLRAPLGLRAFARIIDDERIDMRHRPQNRLRQAGI